MRRKQRCINIPWELDQALVELAADREESVSKLVSDVVARAVPALRAAVVRRQSAA